MDGTTDPQMEFNPSTVVDLTTVETAKRLSAPGLKMFFGIMNIWKVQDIDARLLLGGVADGSYFELMLKPEGQLLDSDKMLRISYLIGIFKDLNLLHGRELADEWVHIPNSNRIFGGNTPLSYLIQGGIPAMQTVRRLLDARCSGN